MKMFYKVKEVADLVGISVRALHHYDRIGLLKPESISDSGYRLYNDRNLERLQQIMFFKELGFSLRETKDIIDSPGFDTKGALIAQKDLLIKKRARLERLINLVEESMESIERGQEVSKEKMFKDFDMGEIEEHMEKYAEETRQKYGHSDAYKESMKKTAKYSRDDWAKVSSETSAIYGRIAAQMDKEPSHPKAQEAIGEWRQYISERFYNCTPEIFRGLGDLYIQDARFTANIDKHKEGLAAFMREAMHIYCDNLSKN